MKNLVNMNGAKLLNKTEQKLVFGGGGGNGLCLRGFCNPTGEPCTNNDECQILEIL